jgi:hypothetical protein
MLIQSQQFYVGLLDGAPAHLAFTKDSLTLELFRDASAAKRHFQEIARIRIDPFHKIVTYGPFEYETLSKQIEHLQGQLNDLRELRRAWWITEKATWLMQITRKAGKRLIHLLFRKNNG